MTFNDAQKIVSREASLRSAFTQSVADWQKGNRESYRYSVTCEEVERSNFKKVQRALADYAAYRTEVIIDPQ